MTALLTGVVALCLSQPADELARARALEKALASGRFAEAERGYLELAGFPRAEGPWLGDELPLAVNAAAQQKGHCDALRKRLVADNPQHQLVALLLDAANGDLTTARAALTQHLARNGVNGSAPDHALNAALNLAAFFDWAAGDADSLARHLELALATSERQPLISPFDAALTTALFAAEEQRKGHHAAALDGWGRAIANFERAGASRHPFLALVLDAQAEALERGGQRERAAKQRTRAAEVRSARGCR
ncbi:MAG: hypothetical protein ACOZQL_36740 [Myxococcota bacterium]